MSRCSDNQEVGLEAATLERVRNSSLVECHGADNPTGQSMVPMLRVGSADGPRGRGALSVERSGRGSVRGRPTSANAGTSNSEVGCEPPPPEA
jgi:hypothetical protein